MKSKNLRGPCYQDSHFSAVYQKSCDERKARWGDILRVSGVLIYDVIYWWCGFSKVRRTLLTT